MEDAGVIQRVSGQRSSLAVATTGAPKLLDRVRQTIRAKHYSRRTESAYVDWIRRYILFHRKRHPSEMGASEIAAFLTWLATNRRVSASTQNQSLSALLFLYRDVLHIEIGSIENVPRARMPVRVPVVLSRDEVARIMKHLHGVPWIIVTLLYGSGLAARMPGASREGHRCGAAADCDSTRQRPEGPANRIANRRRRELSRHLESVKRQHEADLARGLGRVVLPFALDRKYPNAPTEWGWQFVFPASRVCTDPRWGPPTRFHLHESVVQKAVAHAARQAGITKRVGPHTLRHSFAIHTCSRMATTSEPCRLLAHADVSTTMVYTHVLNRGPLGVRSPVDRL